MCYLGVLSVLEKTFSPGDKNRHQGSFCYLLKHLNIYDYINLLHLPNVQCVRAQVLLKVAGEEANTSTFYVLSINYFRIFLFPFVLPVCVNMLCALFESNYM